ncbi:MAG: hypothetical protein KKA76_13660 [Proteobacteria bacterium]|nr:hypothetical protein [Pseudomonadota bacterium]
MKRKYQSGDIIKNMAGLSLLVQGSNLVPCGTQGRNVTNYQVTCGKCGHVFSPTISGAFEKRKSCPGCEKQPAALKTDSTGTCISICDIGMVEFIREFQEEHGESERAAVRYFIDTVKAHLSKDDPIAETMTEESVLAKVRRSTGKKKDPMNHGSSPQKKKVNNLDRVASKVHRITADLESVQSFLDKYLPGYKIVLEDI